jgi:hypothetical protein
MMDKRGYNQMDSIEYSQQMKNTVDLLIHFVREDNHVTDDNNIEPEQSSQILFERFALKVFVIDYMMYGLITVEDYKTKLSEIIFAEILEQAEQTWEDAKKGLEQRMQLYAHAISQRPEAPDFAIMMTFCKLCGRTDEEFMKKVPVLLLNYLKVVDPLLRTFISTTADEMG